MLNPLRVYLDERDPKHAIRVLQRRICELYGNPKAIRWQTIQIIARGLSVPTPETAAKIERGSDGAVTAASLFAYFVEHPPPRRERVRTSRTARKNGTAAQRGIEQPGEAAS